MTDKILWARHRRLSLNKNVEVSNKGSIPMLEAVGGTRHRLAVCHSFVQIIRLALVSPNQVLGVIATPCVRACVCVFVVLWAGDDIVMTCKRKKLQSLQTTIWQYFFCLVHAQN